MKALGFAFVAVLAVSLWGCKSNEVIAEPKEAAVEGQAAQEQPNQPPSAEEAPAAEPAEAEEAKEDKDVKPMMQALGFELGARRALVLEKLDELKLTYQDLGSELRAKGPMMNAEATMSWAFRNERLFSMVFTWTDADKSWKLQDNDVYRALSAHFGAFDPEQSVVGDLGYVRWTNDAGYVELSYDKLRAKVRNPPNELRLTAQLNEVPAASDAEPPKSAPASKPALEK